MDTGTGAYAPMEVPARVKPDHFFVRCRCFHQWESLAPVLHLCKCNTGADVFCTDGKSFGTGADVFAPVGKVWHRCKNVCTGAYIAPVFALIPPVLFLFFSQSRVGYLGLRLLLVIALQPKTFKRRISAGYSVGFCSDQSRNITHTDLSINISSSDQNICISNTNARIIGHSVNSLCFFVSTVNW